MPQNNKPQIQQPNPRTTIISVVLFLLVAFFVGQQFMSMSESSQGTTDKLVASEFLQAVDQNRVTEVTYGAGDYTVSGTYYPAVTAGDSAADAFNSAIDAMNAGMATLKDPNTGKPLSGVGTQDIESQTLGQEHKFTCTWAGSSLSDLMAQHPEIKYEVKTPSPWGDILTTLLPIILIGAMLFFLFNQMAKANNSQMNFGKAKAKQSIEERPDVRFADVAGVDEAVEEMQEIKDFLANPAKYQSMGAKIPRGCLLVGPPGTGKTLLAKAVAGEANVPFFSIAGSEFVEMFVGQGAARVRDLFKQAKEKAPCIVFIDEIDTIGKKRDGSGIAGNDEREQTLNQLLSEMDGFDGSSGVVILAATNRPETLDKALLRPGRFDRRVPVELPDLQGREAILRVHAKDVMMADDIDYKAVARATSGASGAELANLINEAALRAVKCNRRIVTQEDLTESVDVVVAGYQRKNAVLSPHEKEIVAYHEIGHALVAALQSNSAPVTKITIVPRTSGALGYTMQTPEADTVLLSKEEALAKIATLTGGRSAEELIFGSVTSGASNDIEQATKLARSMVTRLGMSETFDMTALETVSNQYLGGDAALACSAETATKIDKEVVEIIRTAHEKAIGILKDNMDKLHELAKYLLEKETITGDEFMAILNR